MSKAAGALPLAIVQSREYSQAYGGSNTFATGNMTSPVTAGSVIHVVVVTICNGGAVTHGTPTDTRGNTYTQIGSTVANPSGAGRMSQWYAVNSGAGTNSVSCTVTGAALPTDASAIVAIEVGGVKTASVLDGSNAAYNAGDSGPNVVVSGSASNTKQPAIVIGVGWDAQGVINSPGTGFTSFSTGWLMGEASAKMMVEYKLLSATGSQQATFSDNAFNQHLACMAIFDALNAT
jgi:hypothetical protein